MALGSLFTLRSLVRVKIKEPAPKEFTDLELNALINLGQLDVARRLVSINKEWLAKTVNLSVVPINGAGLISLPSDCLQIEAITTANGIPIVPLPLDKIGLVTSNAMFQPSLSNPYYFHIGNNLKIYGVSSGYVTMTYIQKPPELVDDDDISLIPTQFLNLVVAYVVWQCAARVGLDESQKEKEYDEGFVEVERLLQKSDVKRGE